MADRFARVFEILNDAGVRYLVAGGVAVVFHGHLRATGDLDLIIDLNTENLTRAMNALERSGFQPRAPVPISSFADPETRRSWVETKNLQVFSVWHEDLPHFEVDIFVEAPFDFDAAWQRRVEVPVQRTTAPVLCLDDLLFLKRRAGRRRDLEDIAALEAIAREDHHE